MELPPMLEQQFAARLESYQEEQRMKYVTTIERMAEQRGLEQGLEQGAERTLREAILAILEIRFKNLPTDILEMLEQIKATEQLQSLHRQAITVDSLAAFEESVAQITVVSHSRLASNSEV
jgi:cell division protein FtsX